MMQFLKNTFHVFANAARHALRQLVNLVATSGGQQVQQVVKQTVVNVTGVAAIFSLIYRLPFISTFSILLVQGLLMAGLAQVGQHMAGPNGRIAGNLAGWALASQYYGTPRPAVVTVVSGE